jgi:hypothetical protein
MKINIEIDKLVLEGFEYHDHLDITAAIESHLSRLISENGLFIDSSLETRNHQEIQDPETKGSLNISLSNNHPNSIGEQIAGLIYSRLALAQNNNSRQIYNNNF